MFTRTGQYALQAAVYLAQNKDRWPIPGNVIADQLSIPRKYLSKVLADLVRAGILSATRGKSGGFRMARSPDEISLVEIVAPFEPNLLAQPARCPFGNQVCGDENPCGAHDRWKQVKNTYLEFLERTSVDSIAQAEPPKSLKRPQRRAKRA